MDGNEPPSDSTDSNSPAPPGKIDPDPNGEYYDLWKRVRDTLYALPSFFQSELNISSIQAPDIYTLNSSLGATIEAQAVATLNKLRGTWDPREEYTGYRFVRQPQTFPDVTLRALAPDANIKILMGIELKGWFVLAKESKPSFRYEITPMACAPMDLLVVYPWALSNVIAGSPRLFEPYITSARYAAEYRNYHWQYLMKGSEDRQINVATATGFYPLKSDKVSDHAVNDSGNNFGRFARTKLMDEYIKNLLATEELAGIPLDAWQRFLAIFTQSHTEQDTDTGLHKLASDYAALGQALIEDKVEQVMAALQAILRIVAES